MDLRLHHTPAKRIVKTRSYPQKLDYKPEGLWYDSNGAWKQWCKSEMPSRNRRDKNHFSLEFKPRQVKKILFLDSVEKIEAFIDKYGAYPEWMENSEKRWIGTEAFKQEFKRKQIWINWDKVASEYAGIEIIPYQFSLRHKYSWYYGWDVASGCIWSLNVIKKVKKIKRVPKPCY